MLTRNYLKIQAAASILLILLLLSLFLQKGFCQESENPNAIQNKVDEIVQERNQYLSIGIGLPGLPSLEYGYRLQNHHHGVNIAVQGGFFAIFLDRKSVV